MSKKITVVGSLNMDLVITTPKIPQIGETLLGSGFMTAPGGKGANQAVAAAKLGGEVTMLGSVGDDLFGRDLVDNLSRHGVDVSRIEVTGDNPTGIAVILIKDGNNCIIVDPGANSSLTAERVAFSRSVIEDSALILVQLEIPLESVQAAIYLAKRQGVKVILNPAPARVLDDQLLKMVDILTPNESECELITGIRPDSEESAREAVNYLKAKGIPQIIITLGSKGVVYNSGERIIHKPVPKVEAVDTTAAGDSFSGALAVALSEGKTIDEAVDFANSVGTLTVMKQGAQSSLPTLEEVLAFTSRQKP